MINTLYLIIKQWLESCRAAISVKESQLVEVLFLSNSQCLLTWLSPLSQFLLIYHQYTIRVFSIQIFVPCHQCTIRVLIDFQVFICPLQYSSLHSPISVSPGTGLSKRLLSLSTNALCWLHLGLVHVHLPHCYCHYSQNYQTSRPTCSSSRKITFNWSAVSWQI